MRPAPLLIRLASLIAATALLVPVAPPVFWVVALMVLSLAAAASADVLSLRGVRFVADRPAQVAVPLGEAATLQSALRAIGGRSSLHLDVRQTWPGVVEPASTSTRAIARPGEVVTIESQLRGVERGTASAPAMWAAATRFGLMERIVPVGDATTIHVLPNLRAVGRLHKRLNQFALRSLGARTSPRIGKGRDFDRLRDYVIDDDFRDIAWRASARHGRLIVRDWRIDRSQDILVCIDRGHRMAARVEHITTLDHAVNAAVLLSYVCNRMEDKVGVLSFDADTDKGIVQGRGTKQLRAISAYLTQLEAAYRYTDYLALATTLRRRLHHRTLILIMTVLPEREERHDLLRAVKMLAPQHLPILLVLRDRDLRAAAEMRPSSREELSRSIVARDIWLGRVEFMRELRASGALVADTDPGDAAIDAVNAYVDVKRRQLL